MAKNHSVLDCYLLDHCIFDRSCLLRSFTYTATRRLRREIQRSHCDLKSAIHIFFISCKYLILIMWITLVVWINWSSTVLWIWTIVVNLVLWSTGESHRSGFKLPWDGAWCKFTSGEHLRASVRPVSSFCTYRHSCSISLASSLFSVTDDIPIHSNESLHKQSYHFCTRNTVSLGFVSWTLQTSMKNTFSLF